jgi:hypothetical protein
MVSTGVVTNSGQGDGINLLMTTDRGGLHNPKTTNAADETITSRFLLWSTLPGMLVETAPSSQHSLIFIFNQLLAKYLNAFYDKASRKIYRPLVDRLANGVFSRAVMGTGYSLPDLVNNSNNGIDNTSIDHFNVNMINSFGIRGDPTDQGVLCQSLALILQRLVTDVSPSTNISDHLISTLSENPLYMREAMRANLYSFIKLFETLRIKCDLYKQVMSLTQIQCGRPFFNAYWVINNVLKNNINQAIETAKIIVTNKNGLLQYFSDTNNGYYSLSSMGASIHPISSTPRSSEETKERILAIINMIDAGSLTIINAAAECLRELADEPRYLEVSENAIAMFQDRLGYLPLMPLSVGLTYLRNKGNAGAPVEKKGRLLPDYSLGEVDFKLAYGTRKLLQTSARVALSELPSVKQTLEVYNATAPAREKVDTNRFEVFLNNTVTLLRYIVNIREHYGSITSPLTDTIPGINLIKTGNGGGVEFVGNTTDNVVYAARVTPMEAVASVENTYVDQELAKIVSAVRLRGTNDVDGTNGSGLGVNRQKERLYNLFELNVMPINVHALMQSTPLCNLFNYAYTFEEMLAMAFGQSSAGIRSMNNAVNTRELFVLLMFDPYAPVDFKTYGAIPQVFKNGANGLAVRILRGDDALQMGRPRFLSDQLLNKVLFNVIYPDPNSQDEAGPLRAYTRPPPSITPTLQKLVNIVRKVISSYVMKRNNINVNYLVYNVVYNTADSFDDSINKEWVKLKVNNDDTNLLNAIFLEISDRTSSKLLYQQPTDHPQIKHVKTVNKLFKNIENIIIQEIVLALLDDLYENYLIKLMALAQRLAWTAKLSPPAANMFTQNKIVTVITGLTNELNKFDKNPLSLEDQAVIVDIVERVAPKAAPKIERAVMGILLKNSSSAGLSLKMVLDPIKTIITNAGAGAASFKFTHNDNLDGTVILNVDNFDDKTTQFIAWMYYLTMCKQLLKIGSNGILKEAMANILIDIFKVIKTDYLPLIITMHNINELVVPPTNTNPGKTEENTTSWKDDNWTYQLPRTKADAHDVQKLVGEKAEGYGFLTYLDLPDDATSDALKVVQFGDNAVNKLIHLNTIGKFRFDTRLTRLLIFIANAQRLVRKKIDQELMKYREVLTTVVTPSTTEYDKLPVETLDDRRLRSYGPYNETTKTRRYIET